MISNALLTFLLNAIWQMLLIAYLCDYLLKQTNARIRHTLWFVILILCFSLPIFSMLRFLKSGSSEFSIIKKLNIERIYNSDLQAEISKSSAIQPAFSESFDKETNSAFIINKKLSVFLIGCYVLFSFYSLVKFFNAWRRTRLLIKTTVTITLSDDMMSVFESCQEHFGAKTPQILFSKSITSPFTVGVLKPLIVLPIKFSAERDRDLLFSVIGHELAHIKKRDYLLNLICEFICLSISFHPVK